MIANILPNHFVSTVFCKREGQHNLFTRFLKDPYSTRSNSVLSFHPTSKSTKKRYRGKIRGMQLWCKIWPFNGIQRYSCTTINTREDEFLDPTENPKYDLHWQFIGFGTSVWRSILNFVRLHEIDLRRIELQKERYGAYLFTVPIRWTMMGTFYRMSVLRTQKSKSSGTWANSICTAYLTTLQWANHAFRQRSSTIRHERNIIPKLHQVGKKVLSSCESRVTLFKWEGAGKRETLVRDAWRNARKWRFRRLSQESKTTNSRAERRINHSCFHVQADLWKWQDQVGSNTKKEKITRRIFKEEPNSAFHLRDLDALEAKRDFCRKSGSSVYRHHEKQRNLWLPQERAGFPLHSCKLLLSSGQKRHRTYCRKVNLMIIGTLMVFGNHQGHGPVSTNSLSCLSHLKDIFGLERSWQISKQCPHPITHG